MLLELALTRQRDEMMENFSHILQRLAIASGAYSSSNHFGGTSPFKVQVNFDLLTYPNGAHMTFGASFPRVRFLDV